MHWKFNPAYFYAFIADLMAAGVGVGLIVLTDVQQELVLKAIASLIVLITGASIPVARSVNTFVTASYQRGYASALKEHR